MSDDSDSGGEEKRVPAVKFRDLVAWNFLLDGDDTFFCRNCKTPNIKRSASNCNLIKHCAHCFGFKYRNVSHPRHNEDLQVIFRQYHRAHSDSDRKPSAFKPIISARAKQLRSWIELVIFCNLPLSICENKYFRKHSKHQGMSRKTLRKYIIKLADIVGLIIKTVIGPGNCIADGWSCGGIHSLGIMHSWPCRKPNGEVGQKIALLSLAPFVSEDSLDAHLQALSIEATYELYGSMKNLVKVFTLDDTNMNPATARLLGKPMIGAYCHRLNLASKCWIRDAFDGELQQQLETINAVMLHASTLKGRGKLKEHMLYLPEIRKKNKMDQLQRHGY